MREGSVLRKDQQHVRWVGTGRIGQHQERSARFDRLAVRCGERSQVVPSSVGPSA
jgi:hypothetical protein